MKTSLKRIALFLLFAPLLSCEEEINPDLSIPDNAQASVDESKGINSINYIYKGERTTVKYKTQGDSLVLIEDEKNNRIREAFRNPNLAIYIELKDTTTIQLFDSYEEYDKIINTNKYKPVNKFLSPNNSPDFTGTAVSSLAAVDYSTPPPFSGPYSINKVINVFDLSNYNPDNGMLTLNYLAGGENNHWYDYSIPNMTSVNGVFWNDKLSSVYIDNRIGESTDPQGSYAVKLVLYEHADYSGKSLIFSAYPGEVVGISNLANVSMGTFSSWNNKASSLKVLHYWVY